MDDGLLELGAPPPGGRRRIGRLLALAAPVAVLLAAALLLAPADDVEVAVEETTTTTERPSPDGPDPGSFPAPVALGGPTDGKESIGLPVRAEPATGLVDGQEVVVTGTGFPPGVSVGVVMCAKEAGREYGARGVDACNIGHFAQATSDADGVATATFSVRRLVLVDGAEVDCASAAQRCLLGMGMISDYDTSGGVLVDFDPSVPLPDPPTVSVSPDQGLADGDRATVQVDGLVPGGSVGAMLCAADGVACVEAAGGSATADAQGTATLDIRLWQQFGAPMWEPGRYGRNVDCAVEACVVQVWGDAPGSRAIPTAAVHFAGPPGARTPPALTVTSSGPYRPGDAIDFTVTPVGDVGVEPVLCSELGGCVGSEVHVSHQGDTVTGRLTVSGPAEGNPCIGQPCTLVVHLYGDAWEAPPLLLPEPVEVEIVG